MLIFELTIILSLHTNFPHPQIYLVFRNGNVDIDNDYSFVIHTNVSLFLRYTVVFRNTGSSQQHLQQKILYVNRNIFYLPTRTKQQKFTISFTYLCKTFQRNSSIGVKLKSRNEISTEFSRKIWLITWTIPLVGSKTSCQR